MSKLTVARALTAHVAKRIIKLASLIVGGIFIAVFLLTWALAYFLSAWWWLLVIPFIFLLCIFLVVRLLVVLIVRRVHSERMTKQQTIALDDFVDKIEQLVEARATPLPIFVFVCLKDIVLHRDVTTIKKLIKDSTGLRADYAALEKLFS